MIPAVQIANSDMERFWRLVNTDVRETLQPRLPELRPSACEAMISGLQKLYVSESCLPIVCAIWFHAYAP